MIRGTFRTIGLVLAHLLLSTLGVAIGSAIGFYSLKPALSPLMSPETLKTDAPLVLPFFPIQSAIALASGFAMARSSFRFGKTVAADLVWIIALIWLLFAMWVSSHNSSILEASQAHFFFGSDPESKRNRLIFTLPLVTSLLYGVGHRAGLRAQDLARPGNQS